MATDPPLTASTGQNLGPWIVSILALVQVWVIAFVKWVRKPKVEMFESGSIEVGFSSFGPTLGLMGTLRVLHKDAFVRRIYCSVTRARDGACHTLNWRAFRGNTINLTPETPPAFEVASSFLLQQNNPFKYNIFFADEAFIADISPKVSPVIAKWHEFKKQKVQELESREDLASIMASQFLDEVLFDEFSKIGSVTKEYTTIDRACYWEAGTYKLEVVVETSKPNKNFCKTYEFVLSQEDVDMLRLNAITILRSLCGFSDTFSFAYPSYRNV